MSFKIPSRKGHPHIVIFLVNRKPPAVVASNEAERELLQSEHDSTIVQIKKSHAEQLEKLRQQLASEQLSEEKELRAKMALFLSELKARLQEEKEEEEAKLMEEKQDNLRKLKQQVKVLMLVACFSFISSSDLDCDRLGKGEEGTSSVY